MLKSFVRLAIVTVVLGISTAQAEVVTFKTCHDADTCTFQRRDGTNVRVRFKGIDAPEASQEFGSTATQYLTTLLQSADKVEIECAGLSYKREICGVKNDGADVRLTLVRQGFAWDSPHFSGGAYREAQAEAQRAKRGVWAGKKIVSPVCFRTKKTAQARKACRSNPLYMG